MIIDWCLGLDGLMIQARHCNLLPVPKPITVLMASEVTSQGPLTSFCLLVHFDVSKISGRREVTSVKKNGRNHVSQTKTGRNIKLYIPLIYGIDEPLVTWDFAFAVCPSETGCGGFFNEGDTHVFWHQMLGDCLEIRDVKWLTHPHDVGSLGSFWGVPNFLRKNEKLL